MRYTITPLGGAGRTITKIVADIVSYLRPKQDSTPARGDEAPGPAVGGPAAYYADGGDEPGRWLGRGATAMSLTGGVDDQDFASVLAGRDPHTGARLITAQGSAGRRPKLGVGSHTRIDGDGRRLYGPADAAAALGVKKSDAIRMLAVGQLMSDRSTRGGARVPEQPPGSYLVPVVLDGQLWVTEAELNRCEEAREAGATPDQIAATGAPRDDLPLAEAARLMGVTRRYLRTVARRYQSNREQIDARCDSGLPEREAYLKAHRGSRGQWLVSRHELAEFVRRRRPPAVRVGYDLTLTIERSFGVLALLGGAQARTAVLGAIEAGNDWALAWLEDHSIAARKQDQVVPAKGWTVASFRHYTSRALDPFPHHHNVVANTVEDHHGMRRALDARGLYRDAMAASALATAEMRYRLTRTLGVRWRPSRNGGWEIAGIPDDVLRAFSRRRTEIEDTLRELEEAIGRGTTLDEVDLVVQTTRPAKSHRTADEMLAEWWQRAESLGFGPDDLERTLGTPTEPPEPDANAVFAKLTAPDGICRNLSVFHRGDVLQALVNMAIDPDDGDDDGSRLAVSDNDHPGTAPSQTGHDGGPQPLIVPAAQLEVLADDFLCSRWVEQLTSATDASPARYTTSEILRVQDRITDRYQRGLRRGAATVPVTAVETVLARHPMLTAEQTTLIRQFCTSGHRVQCAVGRPGAGKTTSMRAARQAWEAAGLRVLGTAVKGEATRTLATSTGITTETLAWYLAHEDPETSPLDARTVLVVDEASTVSDRDLDRLGWLADRTGATLRLIGDPAQHGAVEAGGMFRVLCERHPDHTPQLTETHRLRDPEDRAAADALRDGNVAAALEHLAAAGHLHIVEDELDAYIQVLATWWSAHQADRHHPMVDRRNSVRRSLNRLAHTLRDANGELGPDRLVSDGRRFAPGDRVIARTPDRRLHPDGEPGAYVRNGAVGTIVTITPGEDGSDDAVVTVAFDGIGTIDLPRSFVDEHDTAGGRREVGIDHAYAVTSYAVAGATLPTSTSRIDETSSRAETYVDITRGEEANHLYLTRAADPLDGEHLPRAPLDPLVDAVTDRLESSIGERTAWEIRQAAIERAERQDGALGI